MIIVYIIDSLWANSQNGTTMTARSAQKQKTRRKWDTKYD